jgi:hypothetical protein
LVAIANNQKDQRELACHFAEWHPQARNSFIYTAATIIPVPFSFY